MKKLEDIPKNDIFKVPDGYFDTLPGIIQARVARKESNWLPVFRFSLRYALPALALALGVWWFTQNSAPVATTEDLLASVNTDDLMEYINESDLNTEDFLESLDYSTIEADSLKLDGASVIISDDDLTDVLNEFETEL